MFLASSFLPLAYVFLLQPSPPASSSCHLLHPAIAEVLEVTDPMTTTLVEAPVPGPAASSPREEGVLGEVWTWCERN
jgi:hypothetical protein